MTRLTARLIFGAVLLIACGPSAARTPTITPVPSAAPPTRVPAPSPAQVTAVAATSSTWKMVAQFKGEDGGITKPFTTKGPWRLTYLIEDSIVLTIRTYPEGTIITTLPLRNSRLDGKPHIGSLSVAKAGTFALDLFPLGYYQIDVEEPRSQTN